MAEFNDPALPAILGGAPLFPEGPPNWPPAWEEVSRALAQSILEGSWGRYHGPNTALLSERLAEFHEVDFLELCCSGTFAIELALRGLQIGTGEEVILAGYDFIGNFNDIVAVGARPVLIDVDPRNWNLDPELIADAVSPATRAVLVSHLHGGVVPMRRIVEIARAHNLAVIEDACQMPGAWIDGRRAGTWGDIGILSFGGSKLLSAGRGGALLTASAAIKQRVHLYCNRGNHAYPLSELQATVLLPQLERLEQRNEARAENVARLSELLHPISGLRLLENSVASASPGYYKLGFQYDAEGFDGLSRKRFIEAAKAEGIEFNIGFRAFHLCRSARRFRSAGDLGESSRADANMLVLHHPILLEGSDAMTRIAQCIHRIQRHAEKINQLAI